MGNFYVRLNNLNLTWLIFGLLCVNFLSFVPSMNDEQYLLYARQHFNPDWMPGSFIVNEFPGARLLFEWCTGWLVDSVGFERSIFLIRFFNYFLLAFPLAVLFRMLKFSNIEALIIFQIYLFTSQHFYAGEWIFRAAEAKTFAYIFVFWSLTELLKERYYPAFALMSAATYFHILVGGWFAISCFGMLILRKENWKKIPVWGLIYGVPILPFLYYLSTNLLSGVPAEVEGVNLDQIYVYFRNRHHIGLFYEFGYFFKKHGFGVALAVLAFFFFLRKKYSESERHFSVLRNLMSVMIGIGFFFLSVSLADKLFFDLSGGFLLKSYPWRMQGLAFFIAVILTGFFIKKRLENGTKSLGIPVNILNFFFALSLIFMFVKLGKNVRQTTDYQKDMQYSEVVNFYKENIAEPSVTLILGNAEKYKNGSGHRHELGVDFIRRTNRDNFVVYKFVPGGTVKLYEWYKRLQIAIQVEENPSDFFEITKGYNIDFVLAPKGIDLPLNAVFENEKYVVFEN